MPASTLSSAHSRSVVLRGLLSQTRALSPSTPYATARLARLTDQSEYFLLQWPHDEWPHINRTGDSVPSKPLVINQISRVTTLLSPVASPTPVLAPATWLLAQESLIKILCTVL
ncbi:MULTISPECIES: hypothetical protein [Hymenobacter]|nr:MULTISPECIES: hypothetical protein [Hymenobacter]